MQKSALVTVISRDLEKYFHLKQELQLTCSPNLWSEMWKWVDNCFWRRNNNTTKKCFFLFKIGKSQQHIISTKNTYRTNSMSYVQNLKHIKNHKKTKQKSKFVDWISPIRITSEESTCNQINKVRIQAIEVYFQNYLH